MFQPLVIWEIVKILDLSAIDGVPRDIEFSSDGSTFYMIGGDNERVYEFLLGSPFVLSTAVYSGSSNDLIITVDNEPRSIQFNADGSRVYILGRSNTRIYEYNLGIPYDLSTAIYAGTVEDLFVGGEDPNPESFRFNLDGTQLYYSGDLDNIYVYNLSVAYDISTAGFAGSALSFVGQNQESNVADFAFNDNFSRLFMAGSTGDAIVEYAIDPGDYLENTSNDGSIDNSTPLVISLNGDTFQDLDNDNLLDIGSEVTINNIPVGLTPILTLSNGDTQVTLTFSGNATNHDLSNSIDNLTFTFENGAFSGGNASSISNSGSALAYNTQVGIAFRKNPTLVYYPPNAYDISLAVHTGDAEEFSVNTLATEPEGLSFRPDGLQMYVSHEKEEILTYNLSQPFDVSTASYAGDAEKLSIHFGYIPRELVFNQDGTRMYIAFSANDFVAEYILDTPYHIVSARYTGVASNLDASSEESNLRGLTFNQDGTGLYLIGTTGDSVYAYNLNTPYELSTATYAGASQALNVSNEETAAQDISFNADGTEIYVLGDDNEYTLKYLLTTPYDLATASFAGVGQSLNNAPEDDEVRGMTFNQNGTRLVVIGDRGDAIFEYDIDPGNYPESSANDGSINNANPMVIRLSGGETFQDLDNDNILDVGSEVIINNVPIGLTPVMTLSNNDTEATLTFTGNAVNSSDIHDVDNLPFTFFDFAFTNGDASIVNNSGAGGVFDSNVGIDFIDGALPITLLSFDATLTDKQWVALDWKTASQIDNAYFALERSSDIKDWEEIGRVDGAGTLLETKAYTYMDKKPLSGIAYYRLRQVDFSGAFSFSPIRSVNINENNNTVILYPNPTQDILFIQGAIDLKSQIELYTTSGQKVNHSLKIIAQDGDLTKIDCHTLAGGTYLLKVGWNYYKLVKN